MVSEIVVKRVFRYFVLALLIHGAFIAPLFAESVGAKESIGEFLDSIKKMDFEARGTEEYRDLVQSAMSRLDIEAMGASALSEHWDNLSEKEREEFVDLLYSLIELVAYPKSQKFLGDLEIKYSEETPINDGVRIKSEVIRDNAALNAEVVYHLHMKQEHLMIYDIFLDEVSITEDLKYQWDQVIQDSSFSGLLEKMRERLQKVNKASIVGAGR